MKDIMKSYYLGGLEIVNWLFMLFPKQRVLKTRYVETLKDFQELLRKWKVDTGRMMPV